MTARGWRRRGACAGGRVLLSPIAVGARRVAPTPRDSPPPPPRRLCARTTQAAAWRVKTGKVLWGAVERNSGKRKQKARECVRLSLQSPLAVRRRPLLFFSLRPLPNQPCAASPPPSPPWPRPPSPARRPPPRSSTAARCSRSPRRVRRFFVFGVESAVGAHSGRRAPRASPTPSQSDGRPRLGGGNRGAAARQGGRRGWHRGVWCHQSCDSPPLSLLSASRAGRRAPAQHPPPSAPAHPQPTAWGGGSPRHPRFCGDGAGGTAGAGAARPSSRCCAPSAPKRVAPRRLHRAPPCFPAQTHTRL